MGCPSTGRAHLHVRLSPWQCPCCPPLKSMRWGGEDRGANVHEVPGTAVLTSLRRTAVALTPVDTSCPSLVLKHAWQGQGRGWAWVGGGEATRTGASHRPWLPAPFQPPHTRQGTPRHRDPVSKVLDFPHLTEKKTEAQINPLRTQYTPTWLPPHVPHSVSHKHTHSLLQACAPHIPSHPPALHGRGTEPGMG